MNNTLTSPSLDRRDDFNPGGRPTWAEIDLKALASNFHVVRNRVGPAVKVMAIVKANAYGHGAMACAQRLEAEGADWFGVALPEEGIELRAGRITRPILCLGGFWQAQAATCIQHNLVPVVYRLDLIEAFNRAAAEAGKTADVHVKIDTGMGRLGVRWDEMGEFVDSLGRFRNIRVDGVMSHFAAADDPSCEPLTEHQLRRFEEAVRVFHAHGYHPTHRHVANSAAIFGQPAAWETMVRPGGVLYGLWRDVLPPAAPGPELRPVMSLRSRITLLKSVPQGETIGYGCTFEASRKSLIATLPVGYDDGYMRGLSNRGHVIVRGTYAPVVGRISMDLTLIDVTNVTDVALEDEVTLFGVASDREIPVEDLAKVVRTLSYEVTCRVGQRVPRVYVSV
jgi:alanine racemase